MLARGLARMVCLAAHAHLYRMVGFEKRCCPCRRVVKSARLKLLSGVRQVCGENCRQKGGKVESDSEVRSRTCSGRREINLFRIRTPLGR